MRNAAKELRRVHTTCICCYFIQTIASYVKELRCVHTTCICCYFSQIFVSYVTRLRRSFVSLFTRCCRENTQTQSTWCINSVIIILAILWFFIRMPHNVRALFFLIILIIITLGKLTWVSRRCCQILKLTFLTLTIEFCFLWDMLALLYKMWL